MAIVSPKGIRSVDVFQHRLAGLIGETDAVEGQLAVVPMKGRGLLRVADRRLRGRAARKCGRWPPRRIADG